MGQLVYVLMELQQSKGKTKEWRPVAVVSNPDLANQWYEYGKDVDWVPLELDDVSYIGPESLPTFKPRQTTPGEEKAIALSKRMEETIQRLQKIIDDQQAIIAKLQKQKKSKWSSPLLKEADRTILPQQPAPGGKSPYSYDPSMAMGVKPIAEDPHKEVPSWVTGSKVASPAYTVENLRNLLEDCDLESPIRIESAVTTYPKIMLPIYETWRDGRVPVISVDTDPFLAHLEKIGYSYTGRKKGAVEKVPPKPVERVKGGSQPFPETLDAQGLADYIESYASYPVDNEFVYEQFRGAHAVLKLLPIAGLREGGREHNQQSKKNEDKYFKQDIKTQPPLVVENGEVVDGNHRLRADKRRGLSHVWCYVVTNGELPGEEE